LREHAAIDPRADLHVFRLQAMRARQYKRLGANPAEGYAMINTPEKIFLDPRVAATMPTSREEALGKCFAGTQIETYVRIDVASARMARALGGLEHQINWLQGKLDDAEKSAQSVEPEDGPERVIQLVASPAQVDQETDQLLGRHSPRTPLVLALTNRGRIFQQIGQQDWVVFPDPFYYERNADAGEL
jgi:hypothetical protein